MNDLALRLQAIEVVSFDLDETLWPLEETILQAEATLYDWMQQHVPRITDQYSPAEFTSLRMDFAGNHPQYQGDVTAMRKACLTSLFRDNSYPDSTVDTAFSVFYNARSQVTPFDGAVELLKKIGQQYKVAAITNGNADLEIAGMASLFDNVQLATLTNRAKPHREMFDRCAGELGFATDAILHVGDNPLTDVGGGKNAGTLTAWFNRLHDDWPDEIPAADVVLHELSDLLSVLPRLASTA